MWDIQRQDVLGDPANFDLVGISDLDLLFVEGVWRLVVTTRAEPGLTSFDVSATTGALIQTDRTTVPTYASFPPTGAEVLSFAGEQVIFSTGRSFTPFDVHDVTGGGDIVKITSGFSDVLQSSLHSGATFFLSGQEYLVTSQFALGGLQLFRNDAQLGVVQADTTVLIDGDASVLAATRVGDKAFVLSAGQNSDIITVHEITSAGFTLIATGGPETTVGLSGISGIQTLVLGSIVFALVSSAGSNSITVLRIEADGTLTPTDHVIDTLSTRFSGTSEMTVLQDQDRVFIALAGSDDGITVLQLMPNGALVLRATLADAIDTTLQNVSGIEMVVIGDFLHLYISSESELGVTHLSADIGTAGVLSAGTSTGEFLTGGDFNDVIYGGSGDDSISGGSGDDILLDGQGTDTLTGGSGSDVFQLSPDRNFDQITDFERGVDSLDLSTFDTLATPSGLSVQTTDTGALISFAGELTEVLSANGTGLTYADLGGDAIIPLSHGVLTVFDIPPEEDPEVPTFEGTFDAVISQGRTTGEGGRDGLGVGSHSDEKIFLNITSGNDVLVGTDGNDTLNGGMGADTLSGGTGNDVLIGGTGEDVFVFDSGSDRIVDFTQDQDSILLSRSLWGGGDTTAENLIASFGTYTGSYLLMDFGAGERLIVGGITDPTTIADHFEF